MEIDQEPEKIKRVDAAFVALRRAILDRSLEPGARLPAESIGAGFGMSRTLAREVLLKLEGIGLVEIRPKRGAIVARPSFSEVHDVFDLRQYLEEKSLLLVFENWSLVIQRELESHIKSEKKAAKEDDLNLSIQLAEEFHIKLGQMCGNRILAQYLEEIINRCSLMLSLYGRPYSSECSIPEHEMILESLKKADRPAGMKIMLDHIIELRNCAEPVEVPAKQSLSEIIHKYAQ